MARLDRLAPVKETAQVAAAIGRDFSYRLLEAVSPIQGAELQDALAQLMAAELIYGRGAPPEATYVFKHALVQDTAYGSLLRSRRQRIHADIARALEEKCADEVAAAPAAIARHYTEAGLADPAARYWLAAGELALSRSAYAEADRYVDAGLALIPRLPQGTDRQSLELALHVARAAALMPLKAFTAPETIAAFRAAKRLLDAGVGNDSQRFFVLSGLYSTPHIAGRLESALELACEFVKPQNGRMNRIIVSCYRMLAQMQIAMGQNREALKNLQQAVQLRDLSRKNRWPSILDRSRPCRALQQDMGSVDARPPRSGGSRPRTGAQRTPRSQTSRHDSTLYATCLGVARTHVRRFRSRRTLRRRTCRLLR